MQKRILFMVYDIPKCCHTAATFLIQWARNARLMTGQKSKRNSCSRKFFLYYYLTYRGYILQRMRTNDLSFVKTVMDSLIYIPSRVQKYVSSNHCRNLLYTEKDFCTTYILYLFDQNFVSLVSDKD